MGVCVLSLDCYWHGWIKTSPASQLRKLFMGLLKGHMPKTSLNRDELTCGVQTVFKTQRWLEWGTSKISHGNIHKAMTDTFQNLLLKKLFGYFCAPPQALQLLKHLLLHHHSAIFPCLRQKKLKLHSSCYELLRSLCGLCQALRISLHVDKWFSLVQRNKISIQEKEMWSIHLESFIESTSFICVYLIHSIPLSSVCI